VTGDEKWIYFQNPKRKKSWVDPAQLSTSFSRPNRFGRKTMLCVWWDQEGVIYYELLKPSETVNAHRYHQQLIKLHSAWKKAALSKKTWQTDFPPRQCTIAHVNNGPKLLGDTQLGSATPSRLLTRPGIFWLSPVFVDGPRARWAALRCLLLTKTSENDLMSGLKDEEFFWRGIHKLPERWEKCIVSEGKYFE